VTTTGATIVVACVNYHRPAETVEFVTSVRAQAGGDELEVIIVDNSGPKNDLLLPAPTRVLAPGRNVGYFGAASLAFAEYVARIGIPDWFVISNTDVVFEDDHFFTTLVRLYRHEPPAVVAPAIVSIQFGQDQNPNLEHRPSAKRMRFYKAIFKRYLLNIGYQGLSILRARLRQRSRRASPTALADARVPRAIYDAHGAFMIFHRSYFDGGGDLAHGAFLFGEEIYVAETARRLGMRVIYDPRLRVLHREHVSMGGFHNRQIAGYRADAIAYLVDRFFS